VARLLIATTNRAKVREYRQLLGDLPIELVEPTDPPAVEESAATLEENALLKARAYAAWSALPSLADDGGIEIDALGGEPGVRSARWLGRAASDEELIAYTLARLSGVPPERRGARMRVVCALVLPGSDEATIGEGGIRGSIAEQASERRDPGFPYRSVFLVDGGGYYVDEHARFNHRREAVVAIRLRLLTDLIGCPNP
jgi:XTP/dITP diphosphohydrolase